jgi:hypothetical protein
MTSKGLSKELLKTLSLTGKKRFSKKKINTPNFAP